MRGYENKQKFSLRATETLDDFCISVGWQGNVPKDELPQTCAEINPAYIPIQIMYEGYVGIPRARYSLKNFETY